MDDLKKEIGKRIKQCRKEKGMTQKELARKVGCHEITIRQYESGRRSPKLVSQYAIARALSVTYESLFVLSAPCAALGTNLAELGTDCISRQAAIDAIEKKQMPIMRSEFLYDQAKFDGLSVALNIITELPSAQPEIIRCKDCKHWMPYEWMFSEVWQSKNIADYPEDEIGCNLCDMAMKANDFCSRGERREDG